MVTTSKKTTAKTATTIAEKKPLAKKSVAATPAVKKSATAAKPVAKKTAAAPAKKVSATKTEKVVPPTAVPKAAPKAVKAAPKKAEQPLPPNVIPPAKAAVASKSTPNKSVNKTAVTPEERYHMIATAAYYLAERRGFWGGYEMQDWISAETDIDAMLNA